MGRFFGKLASWRWIIVTAVLMGVNAWMFWRNWQTSTDFDVLMHGAQHIYDYASDRCIGKSL